MTKYDKKQSSRLILLCSIVYCISYITRINYNAYFLCTKYASEIMKAQFEADNE